MHTQLSHIASCSISGVGEIVESSILNQARDYENNPYLDKLKPSKQLIRRSSSDSSPFDFGMDDDEGDVGGNYGDDEDNKAGMVKERWKEEHRERSVEKGDSEAEEGEDDEEMNLMAELAFVAEEDAELHRQGKSVINKLKLSHLTNILSKKQLQHKFLDHGVLTLLKNWLEPLPDGILPNINIRAVVLNIPNDLPIDLEKYDRKEQLKKNVLGKVIMFLSKSDEETTANRKLAKELVGKWSRPIFNKSTRLEDMKNFEEEMPIRRPPVKRYMCQHCNKTGLFQLDCI